MKKIFKKWEGGAEKHGGLVKAADAQINTWVNQASRAEEAQALAVTAARQEARELAARQALEAVEKQKAEELEAKQALEAVEKQKAKELEVKQALEAVEKQKTEKSTLKEFASEFLRTTENLTANLAFKAMDALSTLSPNASNAEIAQALFALKSPVITKQIVSWFENNVSGDSHKETICVSDNNNPISVDKPEETIELSGDHPEETI